MPRKDLLEFGGYKPARVRGWKHNSSQRLSCTRNSEHSTGRWGLNQRRLDQGFQTRKSCNSQMLTERKMKGSTGHSEAFHAVRYSGMSHSFNFWWCCFRSLLLFYPLRSLSTDEAASAALNCTKSSSLAHPGCRISEFWIKAVPQKHQQHTLALGLILHCLIKSHQGKTSLVINTPRGLQSVCTSLQTWTTGIFPLVCFI